MKVVIVFIIHVKLFLCSYKMISDILVMKADQYDF